MSYHLYVQLGAKAVILEMVHALVNNLLELQVGQVDDYILNKKIDVKYKINDISNDLKKHIKTTNNFDNMLYDYVLND